MKIRIPLILILVSSAFILSCCQRKNMSAGKNEAHANTNNTNPGSTLNTYGKVSFMFNGADGIPYYFSMGDTVPTLPYTIPHILLSQGDPMYLHSVLALNNTSQLGADTLNAVVGVLDNSGRTNNVLKATSYQIGIQTTLADDNTGGAYYGFTKEGLLFKAGQENTFSKTYVLSNHKGNAGQVLTLNSSGDTATWANATTGAVAQKYFAPTKGQSIAVAKYSYNIINPNAALLSLSISLPSSPADNDWFEIAFTQPVKTVSYTGGKVANNAIKSASQNNCYKKFVFRKADLTWY